MKNEYSIYQRKPMVLAVIYLFVTGLISSTAVNAQVPSYEEFRGLLKRIEVAVAGDNNALALDLISQANVMFQRLETRPVLDDEALHWNPAQINLDRSDKSLDLTQRAFFANESILSWKDYIVWFGSLDSAQLEIIKNNPASYRIQRAVRQFGNAHMNRHGIKNYSIRDMFSTFGDLPPTYLSSDSMTLWRNWLFRCPSWEKESSPSLRRLKEKFESGAEYCREDWDDFYGFLAEWVKVQNLDGSKKRKYERWVLDLGYALGIVE